MPRLVASQHALRALVALSQLADGVRVSELGRVILATPSATQRAVDVLMDDGLVVVEGHRVRMTDTLTTDAALRYALASLEPSDVASVLARANEVVEFAGRDRDGIVLVVRRFAPLDGLRRLHSGLATLRAVQPSLHLEVLDKADLRDRLLTDDSPRRRAGHMEVLLGSIDRTFPDRRRHGDAAATPRGTAHPALPHASRARLRDLARRYHLARIDLFGSAIRDDFRPDSDVDVLVTPRAASHLRLSERVALNYELEDLFGRDVDLVTKLPSVGRSGGEPVALYD
jgi:predicted nucleotidyltransferase